MFSVLINVTILLYFIFSKKETCNFYEVDMNT